MKKALLTTVLVVILVGLMAAPALADSWWQISPDGWTDDGQHNIGVFDTTAGFDWSGDAVGTDDYMDVLGTRTDTSKTDAWGASANYYSSDSNPHGGFATTTNYCKVCHAVHNAGENSYRLLKDGGTNAAGEAAGESTNDGLGNARSNECMYCHNATSGATEIRPYALGVVTTIRGEHTMGATFIPDSTQTVDLAEIAPSTPRNNGDGTSKLSNRDPNGEGAAFGCYDCHSVHGANVLALWATGKILRNDPSNDGILVTDDRAGFAGNTTQAGTDPMDANNMRNNFCADCHNINASWDRDTSDQDRQNKASHVTGPAADGQLEVYGTTETVALTNAVNTRGCRGCHAASDSGNEPIKIGAGGGTGLVSAWPHQSISSKFLKAKADDYNGEAGDASTAGVIGDSNRSLYEMDAVCLRCHSENSEGGGPWGVGNTF